MGNKTFGRWNGHKLLEMADAKSWEMVVIITTVYFCWAVCWKICGEGRTLEMRVKNLIDARLLIKVIIFGWYLFARGPQRLFPKKKQIVCAAHLFRPLQPFQSSYVDLSRPCGGDGGVGGQKSLDHHLPSHTHTGALCCVLVMVMKIVCPPEQAVCWLLHLSCQFSWRNVKAKPKHFLFKWKIWKLITPRSLIGNWGKQLQRIPLHLQFRQAPTSNLAINLTDFLRSLYQFQ